MKKGRIFKEVTSVLRPIQQGGKGSEEEVNSGRENCKELETRKSWVSQETKNFCWKAANNNEINVDLHLEDNQDT